MPSPAELERELEALRQYVAELERALAAHPSPATLERERVLLRTLIDLIPDTIYAKDAEGRKILANRADIAFMGLSAESEAVGKTDAELYPTGHAHHSVAHDDVVLKQGRAILNEEEQVMVRGSTRWLLTSKVPLRANNGEVIGLVGVGRDITERKRTEEARLKLERQLFEVQKMESLGVLAGGLAHDFNNLLVPILGNAGLIRLALPPESPLADAAQQIETAAQHAGNLARQMLAYSGQGRFITQPLNLNALITELEQLLRASVAKNVGLQLELAPQLPALKGDLTQLRQVLLNLVLNASEALAGQPGHISVRTAYWPMVPPRFTPFYQVAPQAPSAHVGLVVSDNGPGMTPTTQARIFDPFFTTKTRGRGLGLAAVLGIVRGHTGGLALESAPGQGTTFTLLFPVSTEALPQHPTPTLPTTSLFWRGAGGLLIFDDEAAVRQTTARLAQHFGFTPYPVERWAEAEAVLRTHGPELVGVLLDLTMPEQSGQEVYQTLQRIAPHLPVIIMSGYSEHALPAHEMPGLAGFLQKPFSPAALQKTLRAALRLG